MTTTTTVIRYRVKLKKRAIHAGDKYKAYDIQL